MIVWDWNVIIVQSSLGDTDGSVEVPTGSVKVGLEQKLQERPYWAGAGGGGEKKWAGGRVGDWRGAGMPTWARGVGWAGSHKNGRVQWDLWQIREREDIVNGALPRSLPLDWLCEALAQVRDMFCDHYREAGSLACVALRLITLTHVQRHGPTWQGTLFRQLSNPKLGVCFRGCACLTKFAWGLRMSASVSLIRR